MAISRNMEGLALGDVLGVWRVVTGVLEGLFLVLKACEEGRKWL